MRLPLAPALVLVGASVLQAAGGQPPAAPAAGGVTTRLLGAWQGSGTILGQASTVELQWARVLDGRFVRLTFTSHIGPAPKTRRFEGHAYYEALANGRFRATWFDSSGMTRPISAHVRDDALVSAWGTPETEEGETTYRLVSHTQMEVVDRVKGKDGTWREFGRSMLKRTGA
jgi:hypothetical protein